MMSSLRDRKCATRKCGTEIAGPGKCGTWNTNNEFHIYACVTDVLHVGFWCDKYRGLHRDGNSVHRWSNVRIMMTDTYKKIPKGRRGFYTALHNNFNDSLSK